MIAACMCANKKNIKNSGSELPCGVTGEPTQSQSVGVGTRLGWRVNHRVSSGIRALPAVSLLSSQNIAQATRGTDHPPTQPRKCQLSSNTLKLEPACPVSLHTPSVRPPADAPRNSQFTHVQCLAGSRGRVRSASPGGYLRAVHSPPLGHRERSGLGDPCVPAQGRGAEGKVPAVHPG